MSNIGHRLQLHWKTALEDKRLPYFLLFISICMFLLLLYSYYKKLELEVIIQDLKEDRLRMSKNTQNQIQLVFEQYRGCQGRISTLDHKVSRANEDVIIYQKKIKELEKEILVERASKEDLALVTEARESQLLSQEKEGKKKRDELKNLQFQLVRKEELLAKQELAVIERETLLEVRAQECVRDADEANGGEWETPKLLTYAVYRVLYGEEFIHDSIISILDHVDKIFVFWDDIPWGHVTEANYKGNIVPIPKKLDDVLEIVKDLARKFPSKIIVEHDHVETNRNQITHLVNNHILPKHSRPDLLIFLEWDHVWRTDQLKKAMSDFLKNNYLFASSRVKELFRTPRYVTKDRPWRMGTMFWNMTNLQQMPDTGMHANIENVDVKFVDAFVHNLGLCMNEKAMFNKILIAIAFSEYIGDTPPDSDWYEEAWLKFHFQNNNHDLEMALGYGNDLPVAYEYNVYELPTSIKRKLMSGSIPHWEEYHEKERYNFPIKLQEETVALIGNEKACQVLERYINIHKFIMRLAYSNNETETQYANFRRRFIVLNNWEEAGLGNRMQAIVSALLFAIVTDRALLVDWKSSTAIQHFNNEETVAMLPISKFFKDPDFEWEYEKHKSRIEELINLQKLTLTTTHHSGEEGYRGAESGFRGSEDVFQCEDYNMYFSSDADVLFMRSDNNFLINIAANPFYHDMVKDIFGNDPFGPLARFLFRPVEELQAEIQKFRREKFDKFTIGLQVRRIGGSKLNSTQEEILFNTAKQLAGPHRHTKFFLTTDNEGTRTRAQQMFGDQIVFYNKSISRETEEGLLAAVVDMFLLKECDDMIVSAASTYARMAYGMKSKPPMFVNRKNECNRASTSQPCFFKWDMYKNTCFTKEYERKLSPEMRNLIHIDCDYV